MMRILRLPLFLTALTLATATLLSSTPASAGGLTLAAEAGPEVVLNDIRNDDIDRWGFGAAGRVGYTLGIPLLAITPEAKLGFQSPGTPNAFSAQGGVRVNFSEGLSPAVFAHAGGLVGDLHGFVWDAGVGLDLTLLPLVDIGVFGAYYRVQKAGFADGRVDIDAPNWHWIQFGVQGALHL